MSYVTERRLVIISWPLETNNHRQGVPFMLTWQLNRTTAVSPCVNSIHHAERY